MKYISFILGISTFLIIACTTIIWYHWNATTRQPQQFHCGVVNPVPVSIPETRLHKEGEYLFKANCKSCHKIHQDAVGPALSGITKRRSRKWIYAFIKNPNKLMAEGDTAAINIYNKYNRSEMTAFPTLTNAQIDSMLIYIEAYSNVVAMRVAIPWQISYSHNYEIHLLSVYFKFTPFLSGMFRYTFRKSSTYAHTRHFPKIVSETSQRNTWKQARWLHTTGFIDCTICGSTWLGIRQNSILYQAWQHSSILCVQRRMVLFYWWKIWKYRSSDGYCWSKI